MKIWIALGLTLALVAAIVALGTAASLRYGVRGRRVTAGLIVLWGVAQMTPNLGERAFSIEPQAMTCLRAINAAQLLYATSLGDGRYARTLDELEKSRPSLDAQQGPVIRLSLRQSYRFELISTGDTYTAIATPLPNQRRGMQGHRSFCVSASGSIYWSPAVSNPAIQPGRCPDGWQPIQ